MNKILFILLPLFLLACNNEKNKGAEAQTDSLSVELASVKSELDNYKNRFKALEYLSSGEFRYTENKESDVYGEKYRVEIYRSEIYKSVYISHIEYYGEGVQRISSRSKLEFEKMTGISSERTSGLVFNQWIDFKHFELKLGEHIYSIEINEPTAFIISLP